MWNFMNQATPATAVLDFTNDFSVLLIGLVSLVGLSAAMLGWVAIRYSLSQKHEREASMSSHDANQRDAA